MSTKRNKRQEQVSINDVIDSRLANVDSQVEQLIKDVGGGVDSELIIEHPAVVAAIDSKRGVSAAYIASIVSALVTYEQSCGWRHLIAALNLLVKFIRWARKHHKEEENK